MLPASLLISCNGSPVFINLSFCGIKLHTFIVESLNPVANKLESSAISAAVILIIKEDLQMDINEKI